MYQFSSKQGTMLRFQKYLEKHAPDIAKTLAQSTHYNTGSTTGLFPKLWQKVAKENAERFSKLQHSFAVEQYYIPIAEGFTNKVPKHRAIEELLFSTAIQHGVQGASTILEKALHNKPNSTQDLIRNVYSLRKEYFSSSTASVRGAVHNRLAQEMESILALYTL